MNLLHEFPVMDAPLLWRFHGFEKKIHEHGLASTHPACQINAFAHEFFGTQLQHLPKPAFCRKRVLEPVPECVECCNSPSLSGIVDDGALGNERLISARGFTVPHRA